MHKIPHAVKCAELQMGKQRRARGEIPVINESFSRSCRVNVALSVKRPATEMSQHVWVMEAKHVRPMKHAAAAAAAAATQSLCAFIHHGVPTHTCSPVPCSLISFLYIWPRLTSVFSLLLAILARCCRNVASLVLSLLGFTYCINLVLNPFDEFHSFEPTSSSALMLTPCSISLRT